MFGVFYSKVLFCANIYHSMIKRKTQIFKKILSSVKQIKPVPNRLRSGFCEQFGQEVIGQIFIT
jgi:hypothetical protein